MLEANDQANSAQWQSDLDEHEKEASGNNTTFYIFPHVGLQPFLKLGRLKFFFLSGD